MISPDLNDIDMCQFLAEQHKIVAIPISVFYQQAPESLRLIRFCFAKTDQTLQRAGSNPCTVLINKNKPNNHDVNMTDDGMVEKIETFLDEAWKEIE